MSRIPVENAAGPSAVESLLAEVNLFRSRSLPTESFDSHLRRARTRPDEPGPAARADSATGTARPSARDTRPDDDETPADSRRPSAETTAGDSAPAAPAEGTCPTDRPESETEAAKAESPQTEATEAEAESAQQPERDESAETTDAKDPETERSETPAETDIVVEAKGLSDELPADVEDVPTGKNDIEPTAVQGDEQQQAEEDPKVQLAQGKSDAARRTQEEPTASEGSHGGDEPSRRTSGAAAKGAAVESVEVSQVHAEEVAEGADAVEEQDDSQAALTNGEDEQADGRSEQTDLAVSQEDGKDQPGDGPLRDKSAVGKKAGPKGPRSRDRQDQITSRDSAEGAALNAMSPQVETAETGAVSSQQAAFTATNMIAGADAEVPGQTAGTTDVEVPTATRGLAGENSRPEAPQNARQLAEPGQADRERFVQRVARAFEAMGSRHGVVRLRLHPPELGSLRLEITVRQGAMTARVEAETQTARNMLLDNLPVLRERLAQQDIKIEQFHVDLTDRWAGGPPDQTADFADSHGRPENDRPAHAEADAGTEEESRPNAAAVGRPGEGVQLNVIV